MTAPVISAGDLVERRVELITNALLHLPVRGAELQFAARQVELALRPEMDEAAASIQELEAALKPFAEVAEHYRGDHAHNNMAARSGFSGKDDYAPFIPVSALRAARSSLNQDGGKP